MTDHYVPRADIQSPAATGDRAHAPRQTCTTAVDADELVRRAAAGDRTAWECLVEKYSRLIWAMTRDFKLAESDAADVVQATWLRLLEHIDRIEHPDRLGSWLATTARHECLRQLAAARRVTPVQHDDMSLSVAVAPDPDIEERLLAQERAEAVREAISVLPSRSQRLLELLMADPPVPYTDISDLLGVPIGSIGPTRGRCLERLRLLLEAVLAPAMSLHQRVRDHWQPPDHLHLQVLGANLGERRPVVTVLNTSR
jgi:RNA polymerase sigma factor (sigma-70 family)